MWVILMLSRYIEREAGTWFFHYNQAIDIRLIANGISNIIFKYESTFNIVDRLNVSLPEKWQNMYLTK